MATPKTRFTTGDIQRDLQLTRAVLDRLLRDYGRELPEPEIVGGTRQWSVEDLESFREVVRKDQHHRR